MMTTVTIYHNVQHDCLECRQPVISLGDDEWAHLREGADHIPTRVIDNFHAYQPGHAMVPVYQAEVPDGRTPDDVARRILDTLYRHEQGLPRGRAGAEDWELASGYRARGLRPLQLGDVIDVGGTLLARWKWKLMFTPVTGEIRVTWVPYPGTVPLPHCWFCHAIAGEAVLEPFNRAGTLACRNGEACTGRTTATA
jgi:hypothetical protein